MKNKDKYKLTNLKFKTENVKNESYRLPIRKWKVIIYENGVKVGYKTIDGGGISDIMAWLERDEDDR